MASFGRPSIMGERDKLLALPETITLLQITLTGGFGIAIGCRPGAAALRRLPCRNKLRSFWLLLLTGDAGR